MYRTSKWRRDLARRSLACLNRSPPPPAAKRREKNKEVKQRLEVRKGRAPRTKIIEYEKGVRNRLDLIVNKM